MNLHLVFLDAKEILFNDDWLARKISRPWQDGRVQFLLLDDGRLLFGSLHSHVHALILAEVPREEIAAQIRDVWCEDIPTFSMPCVRRVRKGFEGRVQAAGMIQDGIVTSWSSGPLNFFTPDEIKPTILEALKPLLRKEPDLCPIQPRSEQPTLST